MATLSKRIVAYGVLAAVAAVVVFVSVMPAVEKQVSGRRGKKGGDGAAVPVIAAQARIADVPVHLNGVGTAKPRNTVTVRPQVDGRILNLSFKEGQDVKRGDVLAKIDPATYQAQLDQAAAKKAFDEVQLANAHRDLDRYTKLGGNVVAQKTIDTQRALVDQLVAQIKQDDAAIANAKAFLDYTTILSPLDGRTGIRLVDEGNLVRASDAGIVVINEVRPINVLFALPQQQLAQVNSARAAGTVTIEALDADGKTALDRGTLQVIDNQVDQTTGTVRMKGEFPNADLQLWPGQFVNVRILIKTLQQVVVIPTQAVQRGPGGAFAYVVQQDQRVGLRPVTLTLQNETQAVVAKGIEAGEQVVTTGFARLKDGSRVELSAPEEPGTDAAKKSSPAVSEGRGKLRTACAADIQKFCAGVERGGIRECLKANTARLSDGCKAAAPGSGKPREADASGKGGGSSTQ
ncbi:MAG TPA: efflux RND transporter periplasmic adaptor subunit [Hyphomicrobiaceae bacterium]|nr:efflux RND transporter periplasmic adaptor subunit [Hyphomicrobiaceae bacterium]